jgi:sarcosine oxidase subunit beta
MKGEVMQQSRSQTSTSTDVAVIGGGIMGTSIAWHLAQRGAGRVTLLERATVSAGASGKTGALLRRHYSNEPEAMLAHLSFQVFSNWAEIVGGDCGHVPTGIIFTVDTSPGQEANLAALHKNVALQNHLGIDSRVISPAELKELQPFAYVDDLQAVSYEPTSGYVDAIAATRSMASAALRAGADIIEGCRVLGIAIENDRVAGVITDDGVIPAGVVVCAAGPWSPSILASTGLKLPIEALRVQIAIVHRPMELDTPHFVYLDTAAGMFTRPWAPGRSLIGVSGGDQHDAADPDAYDERNDRSYPAQAIAAAAKRMPAMAKATYLHGHAGLYDMTPDAHPIIGPTGIDGLYLAAGFSGAGFKKGPAVGQCLAEQILDGQATTVDLNPFRLSRFEDDGWLAPWSETEYVFSSDFGHKF